MDVENLIQHNRLDQLVGRISVSAGNIRGTPAYWARRRQELVALFEHHKPPTIFFTFSVADFFWADLAKQLSHAAVSSVSDRRAAALENPCEVDEFAELRVQQFLKYFYFFLHLLCLPANGSGGASNGSQEGASMYTVALGFWMTQTSTCLVTTRCVAFWRIPCSDIVFTTLKLRTLGMTTRI
jgi:hypothetical protein